MPDILNTKAIDSNVVDPFLDRVEKEIIPQLEDVIQRRIAEALAIVQTIETKAAVDVKDAIAPVLSEVELLRKELADTRAWLSDTLASLSGWRITLDK